MGNPPPDARSLIGREEELLELRGLLERNRLITLTGPPGIGKSRLAAELARIAVEDYPQGTATVELAALPEEALLPQALASALSIKEAPGKELIGALVAHLAEQRLLLVLDNCEHLLEACSALAEALLAGCPGLSILATSREPLDLADEIVWQVPPLPVPDPSADGPSETLMDYPAVRLFVERTRAVEPGFSLNDYIAPSVAEICRRLDGIPLAIELAAAMVDSLTPPEIANRLDDRLDLLAGGAHSGLPHHQTLAAALDWSYQLLSEPERALLRRLSVFAGGFDLEAAASVCAGDKVAAASVPVLVERLVSRSLVVSDPEAGRLRLLETVRAYAGDRLQASGEARGVREAHAHFYVALAQAAEPELTGPDQANWLGRLEGERANLRSALGWLTGHGLTDSALRLGGALVPFWRLRCHFSEGRDLLEAVVSLSEGEANAGRAKALSGAGLMILMAGEPDRALARAEEAMALSSQLNDPQSKAHALLVLGGCWQFRDVNRGLAYFLESAACARTASDSWCLVHSLCAAGMNYCGLGDYEAAEPLFEECLELGRGEGDKQALRMGLLGLGMLAYYTGEYGAAEGLLEEAATVAQDLGEGYTQATALRFLGATVGDRDRDRAGQLLDRSIDLLRVVRPADLIEPLVKRAQLARADGDRALARSLLEEALSHARGGAEDPEPALRNMGEFLTEQGETRPARRLLDEALDLARCSGDKQLATARNLHSLGRLERIDGNESSAAALHNEAVALQHEIGDLRGIAASFEALAGLAVTQGNARQAGRLFGAAEALREAHDYVRAFADASSYEADMALLRKFLSEENLEAALKQGAALPLDVALRQALNVNGRNGEDRRAGNLSRLTDAEWQVAVLVAEGLTNLQIAERLFIAPGTVKNHVSHIFTKLDVASRTELARVVLGREQPQGPED